MDKSENRPADKHGQNVLIFGGTFNPVHIGHLRMAIETWESLGDVLDHVDFMPAFRQPLKKAAGILPFELRVQMIESVLQGLPDFYCSVVEKLRSGPSYTYETLRSYPETEDKSQRFFLLGSQDYEYLPKWYRGMELIDTANLVVAPRGDFDEKKFLELTRQFWKDKIYKYEEEKPAGLPKRIRVTLHNETVLYYLDLPRLEISATAIRDAWLKGLDIKWLTPDSIVKILENNRELIKAEWQEE